MNILKRLRKPSLSIFLASLVLFVSCKDNETFQDDIRNEFKSTLIKNLDMSKDLNNLFVSKYSNETNNDSSFDFDNIYQVENTETGGISYMINSYDDENIKLGVYPNDNGNYNFLVVEYIDNGDVKEVLYKKATGELLVTIVADSIIEQVSVINHIGENASKYPDCGQLVADCLEDTYTNRGWASVGLWVITGFFPAFGVGAVLGCAAAICFEE